MLLFILGQLLLKCFSLLALGIVAMTMAGASLLVSSHPLDFDFLMLVLLGVLDLLNLLLLFSNLLVHLLESFLALFSQFRAHDFLLCKFGFLCTGSKMALLLLNDLIGCCLAGLGLNLLLLNFMQEMSL